MNAFVGFLAFLLMVVIVGTIVGVSSARSYTGCDTLGNKPMNGSGQVSNNRR